MESTDKGTSFQILWPLAGSVLPGEADEGAVLAIDLTGAQILIVDDNPAVLELVANEVAAAGAEYASCTNPLEALALIYDDASYWNAVIVDYDMPGINGAEFADAVHGRWPALPIILCTALPEPERVAPASLFDAVVSKSSLPTELPRALQRVLSRAKMESL